MIVVYISINKMSVNTLLAIKDVCADFERLETLEGDTARRLFFKYRKDLTSGSYEHMNTQVTSRQRHTLCSLIFSLMCRLEYMYKITNARLAEIVAPLTYITTQKPVSEYTRADIHSAVYFMARGKEFHSEYLAALFVRISQILWHEDDGECEFVCDMANIFRIYWREWDALEILLKFYEDVPDTPVSEAHREQMDAWVSSILHEQIISRGEKQDELIYDALLSPGDRERHTRNNNGIKTADKLWVLMDQFDEVQIADIYNFKRLSLRELNDGAAQLTPTQQSGISDAILTLIFNDFCKKNGFSWKKFACLNAVTICGYDTIALVLNRTFPVIYSSMGLHLILYSKKMYPFKTLKDALISWIVIVKSIHNYSISVVEKKWDLSFLENVGLKGGR